MSKNLNVIVLCAEQKPKEEPRVTSEQVEVKEEPPATPVKQPAVFSETVKTESESPAASPQRAPYMDDSPMMVSQDEPVKMEESDSEDDTPLVSLGHDATCLNRDVHKCCPPSICSAS